MDQRRRLAEDHRYFRRQVLAGSGQGPTERSFATSTGVIKCWRTNDSGQGTTLTLTSRSGTNLVQDFSTANFSSVGYGAAGFSGGLIGEVIVYDRVLTAPERLVIAQHFQSRF